MDLGGANVRVTMDQSVSNRRLKFLFLVILLLIACPTLYITHQRKYPVPTWGHLEDAPNTQAPALEPGLHGKHVYQDTSSSLPLPTPGHLLTLFTTFTIGNFNSFIQNRTIRNWSKLYPSVFVVVYTDDVTVMSHLEDVPGCYVRSTPMVLTERRLPVLKHMYTETMSHFKSKYYSFVNSDILFTKSLLDTLDSLDMLLRNTTHPILLVGQRWNVLNMTDAEASSDIQILRTSRTRGTIMPSWAADFFITNRMFPWQFIPDVVIGVPNYDNWLMMTSKTRNYTAIDITLTTVAVHQSVSVFAYNSAYKPFSDFNRNLLKTSLNVGLHAYASGRTDCLPLFTEYETKEKLSIVQRTKYAPYCHGK